MLEKIKSLFDIKLWKFLLVGILNTAVGEGLKFVLLRITPMGPLPVGLIATAIASVMSYFLNKYFTFKYQGDGKGAALRFTLNILICWALSNAIGLLLIYPLLTHCDGGWFNGLRLIGNEKNGLADYIATYSASVLFVGFNYLGQRFFAFREKASEEGDTYEKTEE